MIKKLILSKKMTNLKFFYCRTCNFIAENKNVDEFVEIEGARGLHLASDVIFSENGKMMFIDVDYFSSYYMSFFRIKDKHLEKELSEFDHICDYCIKRFLKTKKIKPVKFWFHSQPLNPVFY